MATSKFLVKCKTENGAFILEDLTEDSTVEDLKNSLCKVTKMNPENMKILCGYPPKAVPVEAKTTRLCDININSGDTVIIEIQKRPFASDQGGNEKRDAELNTSESGIIKEQPAAEDQGGTERSDAELITPESGIMMRYEVPADDSCLFTSIYFILSNGVLDADKSYELRGIIAQVVERNQEKYTPAILNMSNEEYCRWIMNSKNWGGYIELAILSEYLCVEIIAIDTFSLAVHRFGERENYTNRMFLIYDGMHYDPLVMELNGVLQTFFPASDDAALQMAIEIAQEARASNQYIDLNTLYLCCKSCRALFRGNTEASAHAMATGHQEFDQVTTSP